MNNQNHTCVKIIRSELVYVYVDVLSRLGWSVENTQPSSLLSFDVAVTFSRPEPCTGENGQTKLLRRFEAAAGEMEAVQSSMLEDATRPSVSLGLFGAFLLLVSLYLFILHLTLPGTLLGLVGVACCAATVFLYHRLYWKARQENEAHLKTLMAEIRAVGAEADRISAGRSIGMTRFAVGG